MKYYSIAKNKNFVKIELYPTKSGCALYFILFFSIIIFLIPIATIILLFFDTFHFAPGLLITWIIAWVVSIYLVRLYLWNKNGKEIFRIYESSLERYFDYKYFNDAHKKYDFTKMEILLSNETETSPMELIPPTLNNPDQQAHICFVLDHETIISYRELPIIDIIDISNFIRSCRDADFSS